MLPLCAANAIAYVPFGPLAGGWLTGQVQARRGVPAGLAHDAAPRAVRAASSPTASSTVSTALREEAESRGVSMAALAFAWVLRSPSTARSAGPTAPRTSTPVLEALDLTLTPAERDA